MFPECLTPGKIKPHHLGEDYEGVFLGAHDAVALAVQNSNG